MKSFGKLKPDDFLCDISPDGRFCIIAREGDLYVSTIDEDYSLGKLKKLPSQINTDADESYACFNTNMHYLYFVSDRKGGLGGKDIYRVSFIINKDDVFRFSDIVENLGKGMMKFLSLCSRSIMECMCAQIDLMLSAASMSMWLILKIRNGKN